LLIPDAQRAALQAVFHRRRLAGFREGIGMIAYNFVLP
jgi:hypothetical protein